jgi:hypothetical protein
VPRSPSHKAFQWLVNHWTSTGFDWDQFSWYHLWSIRDVEQVSFPFMPQLF